MKYVFDACALINLANGGVLPTVLSIPANFYFVGPLARKESGSLEPEIAEAVARGQLQELDETIIPAAKYLELLAKHQLGEGETECLAAAFVQSLIVVSDDLLARQATREELGEHMITGSIGLLRTAILNGLIDRQSAYRAFQLMRTMGAFLPNWSIDQAFPA